MPATQLAPRLCGVIVSRSGRNAVPHSWQFPQTAHTASVSSIFRPKNRYNRYIFTDGGGFAQVE